MHTPKWSFSLILKGLLRNFMREAETLVSFINSVYNNGAADRHEESVDLEHTSCYGLTAADHQTEL